MDDTLQSKPTEEEEKIRVLKSRSLKEITLNRFNPETRKTVTQIFEEIVCELLFEFHRELNLGVYDPQPFGRPPSLPDPSLMYLNEELNIKKVNQDINCPKCFAVVKCFWFVKHLALCMNPDQSSFSYSSRSSSRKARMRIKACFKSVNNESSNGNDDDMRAKPTPKGNAEKRSNKKRTRSNGSR